MKKLLVLGTLLLMLGCAKQLTPDQKYTLFENYVKQAATNMGITVPYVGLKEGKYVFKDVQVAAFVFEHPMFPEMSYSIHVSKGFLEESPKILVRHVATHEVCHIYLMLTEHPSSELDAERCVFLFVGEKDFMKVWDFLFEREGEDPPTLEQVKELLKVT
jgi:hypothetical protein